MTVIVSRSHLGDHLEFDAESNPDGSGEPGVGRHTIGEPAERLVALDCSGVELDHRLEEGREG